VTTAPDKADLSYEDWQKLSLAQAHAVEELTLRLGIWMMRAQRAELAAERAQASVARLLRERSTLR